MFNVSSLCSVLRSVSKEEGGSIADDLALLQRLLAALQERPLTRTGSNISTRSHEDEGLTTGCRLEEANLEDASIQFLSTHSTHITWRQSPTYQ